MAGKYVLFERQIAKESSEEQILIQLSCEQDFEVAFANPQYVKVFEGLSMGSPYIIVDFIDANGDAVNINKMDTNAVFTLSFGKSITESRVIRMKIAKIEFGNKSMGTSSNFAFAVHFVHESWNTFIHKTYNRGWSNVRYSDIVSTIASESGFNVRHIAETPNTIPQVTQPNWSNLKLLQHISDRARPKNPATGHFEFGIDLEGNFFFMPLSELISKAHENKVDRPPSENRSTIPLFKLDGNPQNEENRRRLKEENGFVPQTFHTFSVQENYMNQIMQGAGGITTSYYDFNTGTYKKKENKMSETDIDQLSEWSLIHADNERSSMRMYGGRDAGVEQRGRNRLSDSANSIQRITIQCDGTSYVKIGDLVEVLIPNPPEVYNTPYNEVYSGYYIVSNVENVFRLNKRTAYKTVLTLSRQGIDMKELDGYVRTTKGKNIR